MNKALLYLLLVSLFHGAARAGDETTPGHQRLDTIAGLETTTPCVSLNGYVDTGYAYNFTGSSTVNSTGNSGRGDFDLHALKMVLEKTLSEKREFQAGFRADLMLGEDAAVLGKNGVSGSSDSLYLQQAYVLLRAPVGNGLDIQIGKINSILGFEADERPVNFNISWGLNGTPDPGPSAGLLATYPLTGHITLIGGINNGNNQDTHTGLDNSSDGYALTGGLGLCNESGNVRTQLSFHDAPMGDPGSGQTDNENLLGLNWWATWSPQSTNDKLLLAINSSYWNGNHFSAPSPAANGDSTNLWVLALYFHYRFTEIFCLSSRAEYLHTDDNQLLALPTRSATYSNDLYTWTLTAAFQLSEELLFRTEYRLDLGSNVISNSSGTLSGDTAHGLSAQIVYSF